MTATTTTFESMEFYGMTPEGVTLTHESVAYCEDERCAHNSHDAGASYDTAMVRVIATSSYETGTGYSRRQNTIMAVEFADRPGEAYIYDCSPYTNGDAPRDSVFSGEEIGAARRRYAALDDDADDFDFAYYGGIDRVFNAAEREGLTVYGVSAN